MKKILLITPFTPDNQGRGVSPTSLLLAELTKFCSIDLVYFRYEDEDESYIPINNKITVVKEVIVDNWYKIKGMLCKPFLFPIFTPRYNKTVAAFLKRQVEMVNYDFIYFDFSQTFSYASAISHPNKIFMSHDVMYQRFSRERTYCQPWVKISEKQLLSQADAVFTFSKKDCEIIKNLYSLESCSTNFFLKEMVLNAVPLDSSNYFVFFGAWKRPDNSEALKWFLDNVIGQVKGKYHYKVIGAGLSDSLKERLKENPDFEYLGFVDNPYPIIANARAEIAPLHYGAGVKVKCVEALACGTSIIGTEIAFEGIDTPIKSNMLLANTPEDYLYFMENLNESIETKKSNKEAFLKSYGDKAILHYILEKQKK